MNALVALEERRGQFSAATVTTAAGLPRPISDVTILKQNGIPQKCSRYTHYPTICVLFIPSPTLTIPQKNKRRVFCIKRK